MYSILKSNLFTSSVISLKQSPKKICHKVDFRTNVYIEILTSGNKQKKEIVMLTNGRQFLKIIIIKGTASF